MKYKYISHDKPLYCWSNSDVLKELNKKYEGLWIVDEDGHCDEYLAKNPKTLKGIQAEIEHRGYCIKPDLENFTKARD